MSKQNRKRKLDEESEHELELKKKHECDICLSTFSLKHNLTKHRLAHTTFFKCSKCDRKFRRQDYLQTHIKRKHTQFGAGAGEHIPLDDRLPQGFGSHTGDSQPTSTERKLSPLDDHGYTLPSTSTEVKVSPLKDHDYTLPSTSAERKLSSLNDHDYTIPSTSSGKSKLSTTSKNNDHRHTRNSSTASAINQAVQDRTFYPNQNEQYDMLTFFANAKSEIESYLRSRISQNGIKWFISIQVELVKELPEQQTSKPHFRSRTYNTLNNQTFDVHELNQSFQKVFESFEKYIRESSGWVLKKVMHLVVHTVIYSPLSGSSYIELPKKLRHLRSLLNIRNQDQKCFMWSCLASMHSSDSPLVSDYEPFEHELNMSDISYPVSISQINTFEKQNSSLTINIFTIEDNEIIPLRITKQANRVHHINLLLLQSEHNAHYVLIKNLNNFLRTAVGRSNYCHFCHYCLHGFINETLLNDHIPYCQVHGEQKVELPSNKDCFLEFKAFDKTLRVPYVIYADFETLNKPINERRSNSITQSQLLEPCSFGYKVISTDPHFKKDTVIYRGSDASKKLLECLLRESHEIEQRMQDIKPLSLTKDEENSFELAKKCCLCKKGFIEVDKKARHHDHTSGYYIGAAHMNCNLQCKQVNFVPVIFHNLKNFDAHLLCQSIGTFKNHKIKCIPQTLEKYVSFSLGKLRFIDSFGFLSSSLNTLVDNLAQDGTQAFTYFNSEITDHADILLRKGVYPYQYMTCWDKFEETQLPSQEHFYNSLTKESISEENYTHAKTVFNVCKCKTMGDYHNLYLKTDVLLLADVFEQFRNTAQRCYDLDPCQFYSSPGLSWQAMLKMTGVSLELMTDIDQILFIERGIRGGVSQISNRYAKANNAYVPNYDSTKDSTFISYLDINNLYGYSLSEKLPTGFFRFLSLEEIEYFDILKIPEDGSKGYILEVDLEYPEHLHDTHNNYPLAPERKFISNNELSPYAQRVLKKLHKTEELPSRPKVEKLLTTLSDKAEYVLHYRNLQLYLQLGLKLKKIHRILEFEQEAFMKPYIVFNTQMRQQAKSTFEKNFYKLMNNSCFGKTMENLRKHRTVELCHTETRLKKLSAKSTYKYHRIFSEDLVGVELNRNKVKLNKPIYIGMTVLDLSKRTMYEFFYLHLVELYNKSLILNFTDTDSFCITCKTPDIFQDMYKYSHLFDTSDFPKSHFLQSNVNKKVMGKMKSETNEKCISEFCGLRAKMYSYVCANEETLRLKGLSRSVVEKELNFKHYKDVLVNETALKSQMTTLRSHDHQIYCENITKVGLSCFDDKRYLLEDGITSLAYGHYRIQHS